MYAWAQAMGKEFDGKGADVQLGPGVNVARVPLNGRNFEYISGEDPFLGATMIQPCVRGIQSNGVIANMKHYINNNQETNRVTVSANDDNRTRMEMYATPFGAAVEAGVLSTMCSYNLINNVYACENAVTLNGELKGFYNFSGWVMSDWGATHSTVQSALAGLDQDVAHHLGHVAALGDHHPVRRPGVAGAADQVAVSQGCALGQDRPGHLGVVAQQEPQQGVGDFR